MKPVREADVEVQWGGSGQVLYLRGRKMRRLHHLESSRTVFASDGVILKYEAYPNQNRNEIRRYLQLSRYDRRFFPKLLGHAKDFTWVAFQRVDVKRHGLEETDWAVIGRLSVRYGIGDLGFSAARGHNWGIRPNGRPVIFDLGY
jgi:hypothetical protein